MNIKTKFKKNNLIWLFVCLAVASIAAEIFPIILGYQNFFAGNPLDIFLGVLQILIFEGVLPAVLFYLWGSIMHSSMSRATRWMYISKTDFMVYFFAFAIAKQLVMAIIGAFQFLNPQVFFFMNSSVDIIVTSCMLAGLYFGILKKKYVPLGARSKAFSGFAMPYMIVFCFDFFSSLTIWLGGDKVNTILNESLLKFYTYNVGMWMTIVASIALVGAIALYATGILLLQKADKGHEPKNDKNGGNDGGAMFRSAQDDSNSDENIFDEFDV